MNAKKGCAVLAAIAVGVPLMIAAVVGIQTWMPLQRAGDALVELEDALGPEALYTPGLTGEIPAARMELFLELRKTLVQACGDYGVVQKGFDAVEELDARDPEDAKDPREVGEVATGLGGAALRITPFLANYFEMRNNALLAVSMGMQEYAYIYAISYRELLLSDRTRREIFSDGDAISAEASAMLRECLIRQLESLPVGRDDLRDSLTAELKKMQADPSRLIWQDGQPAAVRSGVNPFRERLDRNFCGATAGLEMDCTSNRALAVALE